MLNNRIFVVLTVVFSVFGLYANAPKIHFSWDSGSSAGVTPTGTWEKVSSAGVRNNASTPPGMLAYSVSENGVLFTWKPSVDSSNVSGGADIIGALLSQDESLLVIAERIGGCDKPNSTRLVFINAVNNKLCGGMMLEKRRISEIRVIPGINHKILAIQQGQKEFQNRNCLLIVDLRRKRVSQVGPGFDKKINSVCSDGSKAWVSFEDSNSFAELDLEDLSRDPRYCDAKQEVLHLNHSPLTGNIIVCSRGRCEFFSQNQESLFLEKSIGLPDDFEAVWTLSLPMLPNGVMLQNREGKGLIVSSGGVVPLEFRCEPHGCVLPDQSLLLGSSGRSSLLRNVVLPDCRVRGSYNPASIRPSSRNKILAIFPRTTKPVETIYVDSRGNVFKLVFSGRRGRKISVLLCDKTGLR